MSQNEHIITLIAKQLQGLATSQEAEELQHWLQADAAHQQEYDDMAVIWQKSGPLLANPEFSADKAWLKLDDKIVQLNPRPKMHFDTIISTLFSSGQRVAAAVLVLAIIGIGGYWWYRQAQWQTVTASAQNETITLQDQSVVTLRKGSSIKHLRSFDKKERLVQLTGEAFFKVQPNNNQPFVVSTEHAEVKVVGTSFLVHSTAALDEVVVVTGKVHVTDKSEYNKPVVLTKGQRAILAQNQLFQEPVTDSNFMAWETGRLVFNNSPLPKVLQDISHLYGMEVELAPGLQNTAGDIHVTVQFNNQPIEQALEEIRLITGLQTKKVADKIIFYRN
jgi:ferric-dicitrate binding protein FerR (iron transport regulator)